MLPNNKASNLLANEDITPPLRADSKAQPQELLLLVPPNQEEGNGNFIIIPQINKARTAEKPYFRSVKGYLSAKQQRVGDICRTCYRAIFNNHYIRLFDKGNVIIRHMLNEVVPSLDQNAYSDPLLCITCAKQLFKSYEFKTKCLDTELKFTNWITQRKNVKNNDVDLLILLESSTDDDPVDETFIEKPKNIQLEIHTKSCEAVIKKPEETKSKSQPLSGETMIEKQKKVGIKSQPKSWDHNYAAMINKNYEILTTRKVEKSTVNKSVPFLCEHCGLISRSYRAFINHRISDHGISSLKNSRYKCNLCSYVAKSSILLKQHFYTHIPTMHRCTECGKSYFSLNSLQFHINNKHSRIKASLKCNLKCHVCHKLFQDASSLKVHLTSHNSKENRKYACKFCGQQFSFYSSYCIHMKVHRSPLFSCDLCGKKCRYEKNLKQHKIHVHKKGYRIKCSICHTYFGSQDQYNLHLNLNHENMFECKICCQKFKYADTIKKHYEIFHWNIEKHKCDTCYKTYWSKGDLLKHAFETHQIEAEDDTVEDCLEIKEHLVKHEFEVDQTGAEEDDLDDLLEVKEFKDDGKIEVVGLNLDK